MHRVGNKQPLKYCLLGVVSPTYNHNLNRELIYIHLLNRFCYVT